MQLLLQPPAPPAENMDMRKKRAEYTVIERHQRWHLSADGRYYQEATVLQADGQVRLWLVSDGTFGQ